MRAEPVWRGAAAPGARGLRWPAEWEPHEATWLAWPHAPETWPGALPAVERAFGEMVAALAGGEAVRILVADDPVEERARAVCEAAGARGDIAFPRVATDDAWLRDTGPLFLLGPGGLAALDCDFNAWGGKYPPWDRDQRVAAQIAEYSGAERIAAGLVLEGGSVDGDGQGTLLTTEACLLNPNRGGLAPGDRGPRRRDDAEAMLAGLLGGEVVVWLADGIRGDDTDGHVDDCARFVAPGRVVAVDPPPSHPDRPALAENLRRLRAARDARGRALEVVSLPAPAPLVANGAPLPASYANFYLANEVLLVPVFGVEQDARALAILAECAEGRRVVGIPCREVVAGLGAVHCLTQQQPRQ